MIDLSLEALEEAMLGIWCHTDERGVVIALKPTYVYVPPKMYWQAKLLLEPWRRTRKRWLHRRGKYFPRGMK